jgi:uncharacterized iron-regulated protein
MDLMGFPRCRTALMPLLWVALLAACARGPRPARAPWPAVGFRVYETTTATFVPFERMVSRARESDLVFFGEQHDDPETHRAELALLERVSGNRPVVVSLEMFERDVQQHLDAFLAGRLPEGLFASRSRPWPRYATDYRPLVEFARERGWPVLAANVPRPIASAVARKGLTALDTLSAIEREWAAAQLDCSRDAYYDRFLLAMPGHMTDGSAPPDTAAQRAMNDRFYLAQCVKDETMGESIARAATATSESPLVIHFNGAFHSDFGDGTVARAARRIPSARRLVISAVPLPDLTTADSAATTHTRRADYVIFTARVSAK